MVKGTPERLWMKQYPEQTALQIIRLTQKYPHFLGFVIKIKGVYNIKTL